MTDAGSRTTHHEIDDIFTRRWSPRAFDGSAVAESELLRLFEAARWAPSAFNAQPWRFLYAVRDGADWTRFLDLLIPFNRSWAESAGALIIILSDTQMRNPDGTPKSASHSHSFDAGAAWGMLAMQATLSGLYTHGMTGVDFDKVRTELSVPEDFRIEAAIAVGRIGDASTLPEGLREREQPSDRKPVTDFAFAGGFPAA
ncbi:MULTISPECIES: nitroreductase family protein [unclassified Sphingobium]|uniref:nitroreductase family protein n=1 Tax=unclassified Sphingobium TaxID=2611147 RepID=UPI002224E800|nr:MULTISPECIES: nitroreductase family protein [unclassified Sphingobium]MCW2411541.1 nitroreductase [Sphingobium sp. B8D3D]MCW2416166.1 nitroreductase [Sphingobium sp. B8D3A]